MKSSNKILTITVILLLVTNIALVAFMVMGKKKPEGKHPGGKGDPFEMMAKELNMTEQQKKEHLQYRDEYFKAIKPLFDSVRSAKAAFFAMIKDADVSDSVLNISNKRISDIQFTIDKLTFEHFRRVRVLYKEDQQKKYDELVQKMTQRQGGKGGWRKDSATKDEK
jgi:Spy/CpxP family protein refolding chaperone